ncbi:MAG: hypothetical protein IKU19_05170, partial [Clostridia bacterium]|nr:hypothetical protein [Clostridia bacterium]
MKRILSIILCVAMLVSAAAVSATAWDQSVADSITTENVMSFELNKESYKPGDEVTITAHLDSIWGDSSIEGSVEGYSLVAEGAYGMSLFATCVVFPTDVLTAKTGKDFKKNSSIENYSSDYMLSITKTENAIANERGFYSIIVEAETIHTWEDEDTGDEFKKYGFFNGSGDLCQFKFTVAEDAAPGVYKLPIGPFAVTTANGAEYGQPPEYQFADINDNYFYSIGNVDASANDRDVKYVSPNGEYVNGDCTKGAYVTIVVEGGEGPVVPEPPVVEDPMEFNFAADDAAHVAGDIVEVNLSVKNNKEGLEVSSVNSEFKFDNTALKLIEVSSPVASFGALDIDYDALNAKGKYEDLGKLTAIDCYFDGNGEFADDGVVLTLKFEVLATAAGAATNVTGASREGVTFTDAVINLAANHTHAFTETNVPASCTTAGYTDTACSCGLTYRIADIAKLAHVRSTKPEDTVTVAATCEKQGYTVIYCANGCGMSANTTYFDALGHDLKNIKSDVSCIDDGYEMKKCSRCGYESEKTNVIPKLDHKNPDGTSAYGEDYVAQKPTTNAVGYWAKDCSICGDVYKHTEIPK